MKNKTLLKEIIEDEKYILDNYQKKKKELEKKWIKTQPILRLIFLLGEYVKEKEKFIKTLKNLNPKYPGNGR